MDQNRWTSNSLQRHCQELTPLGRKPMIFKMVFALVYHACIFHASTLFIEIVVYAAQNRLMDWKKIERMFSDEKYSGSF